MQQNPYRRHNDAQDAVLLGWVLILGIFGFSISLPMIGCMSRRPASRNDDLSPAGGLFFWEALRFKATKRNKMEAAWPRPIPVCFTPEGRRIPEGSRASDPLC